MPQLVAVALEDLQRQRGDLLGLFNEALRCPGVSHKRVLGAEVLLEPLVAKLDSLVDCLRQELLAPLILASLPQALAERQRELDSLAVDAGEQRPGPLQQVRRAAEVASDLRAAAGPPEQDSGAGGEVAFAVADRTELEPVAEGLLEVVADDPVHLSLAGDALDPVRRGLVLTDARGPGDLCVRDVADEHVPEGVLHVVGDSGVARAADELLAAELVQALEHRFLRDMADRGERAGPEDLADDGGVVQQRLPVGRQNVEARCDRRLHSLGDRDLPVRDLAEHARELLGEQGISVDAFQHRSLGVA